MRLRAQQLQCWHRPVSPPLLLPETQTLAAAAAAVAALALLRSQE